MLRRHLIFWSLCLAVILAAGWYKSSENRRDLQRQATWQQNMERFQYEQRKEREKITSWIRFQHSQPDAREQIEHGLKGAWSITYGTDGERVFADWIHKKYGIELRTEFQGDRLVAHHIRSGRLLAGFPLQPPRIAISSRTELVRHGVASWGKWLWLVLLPFAVMVPTRWGLYAAEAMLVITLACGTAWLVAPNYPITFQGIFSNDPLFFAAIMYLASLACLAYHLAAEMARRGQPIRFRFNLRTVLIAMGCIAVLLAAGPFGYFALCVFAIGSCIFFWSLIRWS